MAFLRRLKIAVVALAAIGGLVACYDKFLLSDIPISNDKSAATPAGGSTVVTDGALARISKELPNLFPDEDDWRRVSANAIVPSDGSCVFLFKNEPQFSDDRTRLTLKACTTIFLPPASEGLSEVERRRRAFVFDSSDRAVLVFSRPIADFSNLEQMKIDFSAFVSGSMQGTVSIRSQMGSEAPEDDIWFKARDVVFTSKQIRTNFEVEFQFGRNWGNGKGLTIDLDAPALGGGRPTFRKKSADAANGDAGSNDSDGGELDFASLANPEEELERRLDEARDAGNLGGGFSIERIELDELVGWSRFYLADAKKFNAGGGGAADGGSPEGGGDDGDEGDDGDGGGAKGGADSSGGTESNGGASDDAYVEIRGKKGVYFSTNPDSLGGWCVRFAGDVEIVSFDKGEKQAQAHCDALYLYLQDPELEKLDELRRRIDETAAADGGAGKDGAGRGARRFGGVVPTGVLTRLEPVAIRAQGSETAPASVKTGANDDEYELTADELLFDLRERRIDLTTGDGESGRPARVVGAGKNEFDFSAGNVRIQFDANNEFESAVAGNGGKVDATTTNQNGAPSRFKATWNDGLRLVRDKERPEAYRLSTAGGTAFALENIGVFSAEEADFWGIAESEPTADADGAAKRTFKSFVPVGASFRKNVKLQSTRGDAEISNEVAVRFGSPAEVAATANGDGSNANDAIAAGGSDGSDGTKKETSFFSNGSTFGEENDSRFELRGEKLDLWCVSNVEPGEKAPSSVELYRLTIRGGVSLIERSTVDGSVQTRLLADEADLDEPGSERARVRLVGSTASFSRKDLSLVGYDVVVDRAENRFDVRGPGRLSIVPPEKTPSESAPSGGSSDSDDSDALAKLADVASDGPIEIQWSRGTSFDGRVLSFQAEAGKYVSISQRTRSLRCAEARLTLARETSIFDLDFESEDKLDFESFECLGDDERPVRIDAIAFGKEEENAAASAARNDGRSAANDAPYYRAVLRNLTYYRAANEFVASGGGAIRASVKASGEALASTPGLGAVVGRGASDGSSGGDRWRIHLVFQDRIVGSVDKSEIVATGGARAIAVSSDGASENGANDVDVDSFDPSLPNAFFFEGDEATVKFADAPKSPKSGANGLAGKSGNVEIDAKRNVVFRNRRFSAICDSLKFDSAKGSAIVSGDGANKAKIFEQEGPGKKREKRGEFSRAVYWLETGKFDLEGVDAGI